MKLSVVDARDRLDLQKKFESFEAQFKYPLNDDVYFRIDHGTVYDNFYRAMGESTLIVAHNEQGIQGTFCASRRQAFTKSKFVEPVVYLGDLKVAKRYQKSRVSFKLMHKMLSRFEGYTNGLAVVMKGTKVTPDHYSGRMQLPQFYKQDKRYILQINALNYNSNHQDCLASQTDGLNRFQTLCEKYYFKSSNVMLRSLCPPQWLMSDEACGMLEDTFVAKRLFYGSGKEIKITHLSYFAFKSVENAYEVILSALNITQIQGANAMFVALDDKEYMLLKPILDNLDYQISEADIYTTKSLQDINIHINTSEI